LSLVKFADKTEFLSFSRSEDKVEFVILFCSLDGIGFLSFLKFTDRTEFLSFFIFEDKVEFVRLFGSLDGLGLLSLMLFVLMFLAALSIFAEWVALICSLYAVEVSTKVAPVESTKNIDNRTNPEISVFFTLTSPDYSDYLH
jgi:hypothetical protein